MSFDPSDLKGEKKPTPPSIPPEGEAYEDFQAPAAPAPKAALAPEEARPATPSPFAALDAARPLGVMESLPELKQVHTEGETPISSEALAWLGDDQTGKTLQMPAVRLADLMGESSYEEPGTRPDAQELSSEATTVGEGALEETSAEEVTAEETDSPSAHELEPLGLTPPHGIAVLTPELLSKSLAKPEEPAEENADEIVEEVVADEIVETAPTPAPKAVPAPPPPPKAAPAAPPPPPPSLSLSGPQKAVGAATQKKSVSQLEIPPELFEAEEKKEALAPSATPTMQLPKVLARGWWDTIFNEDFLRTNPAKSEAMTKKEADFIEQCLQPKLGGDIILDVACGYGRHVLELATRGYNMVGLDLSLPYLMLAAEIATRRKLNVNFIRGDMRDLPFREYFDSAYCLFTSFGYFDDETNLEVLRNINRALRPKGRFLLEVVNRDFAVSACPLRGWWEGIGCVMLEETEFAYPTSVLSTKRSVIFEDGRQALQETHVRLYSLHELQLMCKQSGFKVLEVSSGVDLRGVFFGADSPHLFILVEKQR